MAGVKADYNVKGSGSKGASVKMGKSGPVSPDGGLNRGTYSMKGAGMKGATVKRGK